MPLILTECIKTVNDWMYREKPVLNNTFYLNLSELSQDGVKDYGVGQFYGRLVINNFL